MDLNNFFGFWFDSLLHPKETFSKEIVNSSFKRGAANYLGAFILAGIISIFVANIIQPGFSLEGLVSIILYFVVSIFVYFLYVLFSQLTLFCGAKIFSGKAKFVEQFYLMSIPFAPLIFIVSLVSNFAVSLGLLQIFVLFAVGVYSLFITYLFLKEIHGFKLGKIIATLIVAGILTNLLLMTIGSVLSVKVLSSELHKLIFEPLFR